jgi:hypothetical protein
MAKVDTKFLKDISIIIVGTVMSVLGWFVKNELTQMTATLKEIKIEASEANKKVMILDQKVDFKFINIDREIERIRDDYAYWRGISNRKKQ